MYCHIEESGNKLVYTIGHLSIVDYTYALRFAKEQMMKKGEYAFRLLEWDGETARVHFEKQEQR